MNGGNVRAVWTPLPYGLNTPAQSLIIRLRMIKDALGLSLSDISKRTHYSRASWERWLNGKRLISDVALISFSAAAHIDPKPLLRLRALAAQRPLTDGSAELEQAVQARAHATLPPRIPDFTGRAEIVGQLCDALNPASTSQAVVAITGAGGVGKTALALHIAHQVKAAFPDGQLYVNLREAGGPAEVLSRLLGYLGQPSDRGSQSVEVCAARLRSLTAGLRLLIIYDGAVDSAAVRPLLLPWERSRVIVTSRNSLPGLAGALTVPLASLNYADGLDMLCAIVGTARVLAEPVAAVRVLEYCGELPLAIRIAGARLVARPSWRIAALAARLAVERNRLDELSVEDIGVRACFEASYLPLSAGSPAADGRGRTFRLLGLSPNADISVTAAAALLDEPPSDAGRYLEGLVDVNLLETSSSGRYRLPELLRVYARERAAAELTRAEREQACWRLLRRSAVSRTCTPV